jgi:broad specificity phosphatase PhoE
MSGPVAPARIVLLRHAWAGDRDAYDGDDRERPLDARGRRQSKALPAHLVARGVVDPSDAARGALRLVSSPLVRCRTTLEPLAATSGVTVHLDEDLAEVDPPLRSDDGWPDAAWLAGRAVRAVDRAVTAAGGGTVVVCSHGELLPAALAALAARADRAVPPTIDLTAKALPKGAAWVIEPGSLSGWVTPVPAPDS